MPVMESVETALYSRKNSGGYLAHRRVAGHSDRDQRTCRHSANPYDCGDNVQPVAEDKKKIHVSRHPSSPVSEALEPV